MKPPRPPLALPRLHFRSVPYSNVVQLPSGNFFFSAPSLMPLFVQTKTAENAASHRICP